MLAACKFGFTLGYKLHATISRLNPRTIHGSGKIVNCAHTRTPGVLTNPPAFSYIILLFPKDVSFFFRHVCNKRKCTYYYYFTTRFSFILITTNFNASSCISLPEKLDKHPDIVSTVVNNSVLYVFRQTFPLRALLRHQVSLTFTHRVKHTARPFKCVMKTDCLKRAVGCSSFTVDGTSFCEKSFKCSSQAPRWSREKERESIRLADAMSRLIRCLLRDGRCTNGRHTPMCLP